MAQSSSFLDAPLCVDEDSLGRLSSDIGHPNQGTHTTQNTSQTAAATQHAPNEEVVNDTAPTSSTGSASE
eukprot:CAMPEP_0194542412 /NCGR_PEP_ID=MMETSP0253-20130528/83966_1 /TAXON_ID=2966 /ORGANISM="Noctiluca scintillans" /LENGTH=69 /DNA_ID=CAMNT_0039389029 /DNA_START=1109 /DNA_END=1315 /DNA_ORIENTATION=-